MFRKTCSCPQCPGMAAWLEKLTAVRYYNNSKIRRIDIFPVIVALLEVFTAIIAAWSDRLTAVQYCTVIVARL